MDENDDLLIAMSTGLGSDAQAALPRMEAMPRAVTGPGLNLEAIMTDSVSRFIAFKQNLHTANSVRRIEQQMKSLQDQITSQMNIYQQDMDAKIHSYQQETSLKIESDQKATTARLQGLELRMGQMDDEIREIRDADAIVMLKSEVESIRDDLKDAKQDMSMTFEDRWGEIQSEVGRIDENTQELRGQLQDLSTQLHQASPTRQGYSKLLGLPVRHVLDEPHMPNPEQEQERAPSMLQTNQLGYPRFSRRRKADLPEDELGLLDLGKYRFKSKMATGPATPEAGLAVSPPTSQPQQTSKGQRSSEIPPPAFYTEDANEIRHAVNEWVNKYAKNPPKNSKSELKFIWNFLDSIEEDWSLFIQQELQNTYPHIVKPNPRGRPTHIIQLRELGWEHVKEWFKQNRAIFKSNQESSATKARVSRRNAARP